MSEKHLNIQHPQSQGKQISELCLDLIVHPSEWLGSNIISDSSFQQGCEVSGTLSHCWWEGKLVYQLPKSVWQFLRNIGIYLPQDAAIPVLNIYQKGASSYHRDTCSFMFLHSLLLIVKNWKQSVCSLTINGKKIWNLYTMNYYLSIETLNYEIQR